MLATRTSPFDPPTQDTFVTDDGPGLDTGCTFNDDPGHPLVIDIVIDKFVGDVDASGFLVNPAPLISAGIIPGSIDIIMPAFDVDVNGSPPPERDEVFFNGQSLGFLTGDNQIWKLNSFSIDIGKVKFPSRPASGATPVPVTNRVQINFDTLSSGRWCTAIDWVALIIPIRPKLALDLRVIDGNKIRQNTSESTIDVIQEQTFDAACNVTTTIGPFDEYPFSGPVTGEAKLRAMVKTCPENSIDPPEVRADWTVTSGGVSGSNTWTGFEGDVTVKIPDAVRGYTVDFSYTINEETIDVSRKLFVTKRTPLAQVDPPRRAWYEKATAWASGQSDEAPILSHLLDGLYGFGGANWRYGYSFGGVPKCTWEDLVADPIACNYSDCYVFSDVFENMAATLGIGGLAAITVLGSTGNGFLTTGDPSLDPAFTGNARPLGGGAYDRYSFSSHSLRKRGPEFYDSTFDGIYNNQDQFVAYNATGGTATDPDGLYLVTVEGAKIYVRAGNAYDSWGNYEYTLPPAPAPIRMAQRQVAAVATNVEFPGSVTYHTMDSNGDGIYEGVAADIDVNVLTGGTYTVFGVLQKNGSVIAHRPANDSMLFSSVSFDAAPGPRKVTLTFSGEEIFQSGQNGPYDLVLNGVGEGSLSSATLQTPAYDYRSFGELVVGITGVIDEGVDDDGDGKLEGIRAKVDLNVRSAGNFRLQGSLIKDDKTLVDTGSTLALTPGQQTVSIVFPGLPLRRSNQDGPYEGVISLIDSNNRTINSFEFATQAYSADNFAAVMEPDGSFADHGIDSNGNGLYDMLRITFGASLSRGGSFLVIGTLKNATDAGTVFSEQLISVSPGTQLLTLDFSGPDIFRQQLNGPYQIEVSLRDPATQEIVDRTPLPKETAAYSFTDFDPTRETQAIVIIGTSTDRGIDTDGNGLFNQLLVDVDVQLSNSGIYEWSARLVDSHGTEIGFYTSSAFLNAGKAVINFVFDGERIGQSGKDGPYFVKGLLMFGGGANLVATDVAKTAFYAASEFEGFVPVNQPPVAAAGADQTVECTSHLGTNITLDGSASNDPDGDTLTFTWTGPFGTANGPTPTVTLPLGSHTITLTVDDGKDGTASDQVIITVQDTTSPTLESVTANPNVLWPPNHKMVAVTVTASASDVCSATTVCKITSVSSNEPVNGTGDGDKAPDWEITGDLTVNLRAERSGKGNGRVYTITVQCTDALGNSSIKDVTVTVPHDQR